MPTEGKETVIYLVTNEENSGDKDSYNEYMWDETNKSFELIGSGSYAQQKAEIEAETKRATEKEATIDAELKKRVPYSLHKSVNVVGNVKDVVKLDVPESSNEAMYCPQGLIMGGSAKDAGLVTRGICGVGTPSDNGHCMKENLYINYDGDTTYKNDRQLILQAGDSGVHYGYNLYQFAAARGDSVNYFINDKVKTERDRA